MQFKRILNFSGWAVLIICLAMSVFYIMLPGVAEKQIKKRVADLQLPAALDFTINSIGWHKTMISDIRLNDKQIIGHVEIQYHFRSLKDVSILRMELSGVNPQISINKDNQIGLHGIKLAKSAKGPQKPRDLSFFRFLPDKIKINSSMVQLTVPGKSYAIPIEFMAVVEKKNKNVEVKGDVFFFGEKVQIQTRYHAGKGLSNIYVYAQALDLGRYNRHLKGKIPDLVLNQARDITILSDMPDKKWQVKIGAVEFDHPFGSGIKDTSCSVIINNKAVSAQGTAEFLIQGADHGLCQFKINKAPDGKFPYSFHGSGDFGKSISLKAGKKTFQLNEPKIELEAIANKKKIMGSFDFTGMNGKGRFSDLKTKFSSISINSGFLVDLSQKDFFIRLKPQLKINKPLATHAQGELAFSRWLAGGIVSYSGSKGAVAALSVEAENGKGRIPGKDILFSGIKMNLPVQYPAGKKTRVGSIEVASLKYRGAYSGRLKAKIRQTGKAMLTVAGDFRLNQIPGAVTPFQGQLGLLPEFSAAVDFKLDPLEITEKEISKLVPGFPANSRFKAMVTADGKAVLSGSRIQTGLNVSLDNGEVSIPDIELEATGIQTRMAFNDLLKPETKPGQTMDINRIDIGKVNLKDAVFRFSVEDGAYLLLENLKFKWCQGIVSTEAIRIPGPDNSYTLILYCDRLQLTELLKQMGVFHAEGDGALSGRLPVIYKNGDISFDNGFLFSTPGSGGVVKIQNTEKLTAGIPMDSPQFSQLDVAREALKDFEYKWAKLNLDSFEDNLSVKMQMDGKPSRVLPFVYRKDLGRFVRVEAQNPGSNFQGIKLDVNLNLPFNEVMKFGNKVKAIFN